MFFVNAQNVADQINRLVAQHKPRVLAVDMSRVPDLEYSALQALMEGEKRVTENGVVVWLVGLNPGVLEMVRKAGLDSRLGRDRMLFVLRFMEDLSLRDVAAASGLSLATAKWHLARARSKVRLLAERDPLLCEYVTGDVFGQPRGPDRDGPDDFAESILTILTSFSIRITGFAETELESVVSTSSNFVGALLADAKGYLASMAPHS